MSATPIPNTAPFREDEIELLNRVIAPATPTQRAWLAISISRNRQRAGSAARSKF